MIEKFSFVLMHHRLSDKLAAFWFPFVYDHFMIFSQLDFVILNSLCYLFIFLNSIFFIKFIVK